MKLFLSAVFFILFAAGSFCQPKFGSDSLACLNSLSVMSEFTKMKLYDEAYDAWKYTFINCPASSRNIYVAGPEILYYKIEKASDNTEKQNYIDTLLLLYDTRIKYFGQEGFVSARKAIDILRFRPSAYAEAYELLKKSVGIEKLNSEDIALSGFIQVTQVMFKNGKITADEAIDNYFDVLGIIYHVTSYVHEEQKARYAETINGLMKGTGAATCDNIRSHVLREAGGINPSMLMSILSLMETSGCNDSSVISDIAENAMKNGQGKNVTYYLADHFLKLKDLENAARYFYKTLDYNYPDDTLAYIYYSLSVIEQQRKNFPSSRMMALKALDHDPEMGEAYISIGLAYAASQNECGSGDFEKAAVYWAAVDKFIMAKSIDAGTAQKADELISYYSRYFPDNDLIFFNGYKEGSVYKVECWINETTVIRARK